MSDDGRAWVDQLPDTMAGQRALLHGLMAFCEKQDSVRWLLIGCSLARGAGDRLSDLDLGVGIRDEEFTAAVPVIRAAVDGLGDLVDSYQHQLPGVESPHVRIFAQYADRCQVDLMVFPASASARPLVRAVPLYDPDAVIKIQDALEPPTPDQVREWAFRAWCVLADAGKYLRRGSPWEALSRLNEARDQLWCLEALAADVPDAQYGLTSILDFAPETIRPGMAATVSDLDPAGLLAATRQVASLLSDAGQRLPAAHRAALPDAMARYVTRDLEQLAEDGGLAG